MENTNQGHFETLVENLKQQIGPLGSMGFQVNFPENNIETPEGYLITFGCSWTFGVGSAYEPEMTEKEYKEIAWGSSCYQYSWRKIVSDRLNLININLSQGGSANDFQFMMSEIFFSSDLWKYVEETSGNVIVLWGITSLLRKTHWSIKDQSNFTVPIPTGKPNNNFSPVNILNRNQRILNTFSEIYKKLIFDEDNELNNLCYKMNFWNTFFEKSNVRNFWFDSFASLNYPRQVKNLIGSEDLERDLLYYLCEVNGNVIKEKEIHISGWDINNKKIAFLFENKLVNPYTFHPVKKCHKQIAEFFLQKLL